MNVKGIDAGRPIAEPGSDGDRRLRDAANAFEAMFVQMMLKRMREAQLENGFFGKSTGSDTYQAMFDRHLSESMADGSPLGIADRLYESWIAAGYGGDDVDALLDRASAARGREGAAAYADVAALAAPGPASGPTSGPTTRPPADEPEISSPFGFRTDPIHGRRRFHGGVDLPAPVGTGVLAAAPGRVERVEHHPGYGLQVILRHGDDWTTRYAHLSSADVVEGEWVPRGRRLGGVGSSGRSTGPHLHFETSRKGRKIDPSVAAPGPLRPQVLAAPADESRDGGRPPGVRAGATSGEDPPS